MSKKKGLSLEEKRDRLLSIFHDTSDVFVLKDIEKLGSKKGIVLQTIKEVLQSLVDDDLVHQEKIGSSNYFWAFPTELSVKLQNDLQKVESELETAKSRSQQLQQDVEAAKQGKEDSDNRLALMAEMQELEASVAACKQDLAQYQENDPAYYQSLQEASICARDAANRWLDNVYSLKSWCKQRFPGMEHELQSFFEGHGLNDSVDYIE